LNLEWLHDLHKGAFNGYQNMQKWLVVMYMVDVGGVYNYLMDF
jgi:hypothetical protein